MKPLLDGIRAVDWNLAGIILLLGLLPVGAAAQANETAESNAADRTVVTESAEVRTQAEAASKTRSRPREVLQLGGTVEIGEGEEVLDAVVVFGEVMVRGTIRGDLVVVFGRATVDGEVRGDLVAPFSKVTLGSDSRVGGDLVAVLGQLFVDPMAKIGGQRLDFSMTLLEERLPAMEGLRAWFTQALLLARPLSHQSGWWWEVALALAVLYFLMALIFTRPLALSVNALETRPVAAFFVGLLLLVLMGPLFLMLAATGIGLIVVPFVVAALMVAFLFGKIAVAQYVGRELGRQLGLSILTIPLVALLMGIAIFYLVYMVPVIGLLAWSVTGLLGLGAVSIALIRAFRIETRPSPGLPITGGSEPVRSAMSGKPEQAAMEPPGITAVMVEPRMEPGGEPGPGSVLEAPPYIPGQKPVSAWVEATSMPRVGFWARFGATWIDLILIGVLVGLLHRVSWFIPIWLGYHVAMWAWRGTTIGGIVFGLHIARTDGRPIDFPIALIRALSSILSALALFVGFFWAGWTREKRAWHDLIAGTMIVQMPKGVSPV